MQRSAAFTTAFVGGRVAPVLGSAGCSVPVAQQSWLDLAGLVGSEQGLSHGMKALVL